MTDALRKFKRLAKTIAKVWPMPKAKRPKSADGEWTDQKKEEKGTVELPRPHSCDGSVGVALSNVTRP